MNEQTKASVKLIVSDIVERSIARHSGERPAEQSPFRDRLIPGEFWRLPKFERSFVTTMGSSGFEEIAKVVSQGNGGQAVRSNVTVGQVFTGQLHKIDDILSDFRANRSRPNWLQEVADVQAATTGDLVEIRIISDVHVIHVDGRQAFYTMKTVKPNLDQTEKAKSDCLKLKALNPQFETYFALPYNPFGDNRETYNWSYASRIFNMREDDCVLIGKDFWDDIGGPGTYEELLNIFEEIGLEMAQKIEDFFGLR